MSLESTLAHTTRGSGSDAVVLLHGFLGSGRNLASLARLWGERDPTKCFVLADLLGHGTSPALPPNADLEDLAQAVVHMVGELGLPTPTPIVGHSLGGRVALVARHLAPQTIGAVTLLDIAPGPIHKEATDLDFVLDALLAAPEITPSRQPVRNFLLERGLSQGLADWLLMNLVSGQQGLTWRINRQALAQFNERSRPRDLWPMLQQTQAPTVAIRGDRSRFVSQDDAARFEHLGVSVTTLAGAGHFVHVDALDALLDALQPSN